MNDAVRYLGLNSTKHISALPNAGLPINEGGHAVYKLSPRNWRTTYNQSFGHFGVRIVGGCCGNSSPSTSRRWSMRSQALNRLFATCKTAGAASSAYTSVPLDLEPNHSSWLRR